MPHSYAPSLVRERLCLPMKNDAATMPPASASATRICSTRGRYCQMYGVVCMASFKCRSEFVKGQGERLSYHNRNVPMCVHWFFMLKRLWNAFSATLCRAGWRRSRCCCGRRRRCAGIFIAGPASLPRAVAVDTVAELDHGCQALEIEVGEFHAEEAGQSCRRSTPCRGRRTRRNPADASAGEAGAVSGRGPFPSVLPSGEGYGSRTGAQCRSRIHFGRSRGACAGANRLHHRGKGRKRLCLPGRAVMGQVHRRSRVLEPENQGAPLLECPGREDLSAQFPVEDQAGAGGKVEDGNRAGAQSGNGYERTPRVGARCDVLHDVEAAVS